MRENLKPIFAVMLLSPLLTELLTGNIPLTGFLNPVVYLFLATVGYGFPVLLLREFGVRRGVSLLGMLPLGLCYGIVNEGFLAKTFFLPHGVPINAFDQYGFFGGVEVPWALTISTWHALFAFVFPILLVETIYPAYRGKPWLSKKGAFGILIPTVIIALLMYFTAQKEPVRAAGTLENFIEIWLAFVLLIGVTLIAPRTSELTVGGRFQGKKVLPGAVVFFACLLVPFIFAGAKLPVILFLGYYVALFGFSWLILSARAALSHASVVMCSLGAYTTQAFFGIFVGVAIGSPIHVLTEILFVCIFALVINRLSKNPPSLGSSVPVTN